MGGDGELDREADALDHVVAGEIQTVAVGREERGGDVGAVHFLQRDHVGIHFGGIGAQQGPVPCGLGLHVRRQFRVSRNAARKPFQIPGSNL